MRILLDPEPRLEGEIFSPAAAARLAAEHSVVRFDGGDRAAFYARELPGAEVVMGQQPLTAQAIAHAPRLRCIVNVETNFLPNIDYDACFARGIHVIAPSGVFAQPVAELGLGMALSLARDIHGAHADFVAGRERWGLDGTGRAELLGGAPMAIIGYGDLGRALHRVLAGLRPQLFVHDPWLPPEFLRRQGVEPAGLVEALGRARVVFVTASVTTDNPGFLNDAALHAMQDGAMLLLLSRAAVADFSALAAHARSGRLRIATDVFPEEPVAPDDPIRAVPGMLFSAHRAGALAGALTTIGDWVLEDLALIARDLPPVMCRRAERETVTRLRSKPISRS